MTPRVPAVPRMARGLSWREAGFAALDFETTGLDLRTDTVISFGVVPLDGGRIRVGGSAHQLIEPHLPPSPRSQTIHGLRPKDLEGAPHLEEARELLREHLEGRYLLVWFADIEIHFLTAIFGGPARRWRRRTIDVRTLAIRAEGKPMARRDQLGFGLTSTAERYGVPVASPHEALDDALVTAQLFLVLAEKVPGNGHPTVRELLDLAGARRAPT